MNVDAMSALPNLYPAAPDTAGVSGAMPSHAVPADDTSFSSLLGAAFADAGTALERADAAEKTFAAGGGTLQDMVLERAQADVALSIASAAASRTAQALSTILGMQI